MAATAGVGALVGSAGASIPSNCFVLSDGVNVRCHFLRTGGEQTFVIPAGVRSLSLDATGAHGQFGQQGEDWSGGLDGCGNMGAGGFGGTRGLPGRATGTVPVTPGWLIHPGRTLYVEVGGNASDDAGRPGGNGVISAAQIGSGCGPSQTDRSGAGGAGGGASSVRLCSISNPCGESRIIVGGGGGGGGGGGSCFCSPGHNGFDASQSAVDPPGPAGNGEDGVGPALVGGGGGGGGGYNGGAGGARGDVFDSGGRGGAGGSSLAPLGGSIHVAGPSETDGNGQVIIEFSLDTETTTSVVSNSNPSMAGQQITFTAAVSSPAVDGLAPATGEGTVTFMEGTTTLAKGVPIVDDKASFTTGVLCIGCPPPVFLSPGTHSITAVYSGYDAFLSSTSPALTQTVEEPPNQAPLAFAGPDQTVNLEGSRSASVTLNGSNSLDDGRPGPLTYRWNEAGTQIAVGRTPSVELGLGEHTIQLVVDDGEFQSTDVVVVTVVDPTSPTITPAITGTLGANGWYTSDVDVSWQVTDPESDISSPPCNPASVTSDSAGTTTSCSATSAGGTSSEQTTIKRDTTAPTVTYTGNQGSYLATDTIAITCTAEDALSGIASTDCADIDGPASTFGLGGTSFTAAATDDAGNTGTGSTSFTVTAPSAALSPATYDYGEEPVNAGPSPARMFTLTNEGSADLIVSAVALTGTDAAKFHLGNDSCGGATIAPSGSCQVAVVFDPSSPGAKNATLEIMDNAAGSPHTAALTGTGVEAPKLSSLSPRSGLAGTVVTIIGQGFSEATDVRFGNTKAPFTIISGTQLRATAPPQPSPFAAARAAQGLGPTVPVVVVGPGRESNQLGFTYTGGSSSGPAPCDALPNACGGGQQGQPGTPQLAPPSASDDAPALGHATTPNLRATVSGHWKNGTVYLTIRVLISKPRLVNRWFLVQVRVAALDQTKLLRIRANGRQARTLHLTLSAPASMIGKRVIVRVDPTNRIPETRSRDDVVSARIA